MPGWTMRVDFVTAEPLEHGNWSAVEFETEAEARLWWNAADTRSGMHRVMTLTDPDGNVVDQRVVSVGVW